MQTMKKNRRRCLVLPFLLMLSVLPVSAVQALTPHPTFALNSHYFSMDTSAIAKDNADPFPNATSSTPTTSPTPLATPALHADNSGEKIVLSVKDAEILDDRGNVVRFKGLVKPSLEWDVHGQYMSKDDIQLMHESWGADAIRLDLYQDYWFNSGPVTQSGSYKQIIDAIIYYAIQNNMAIILDLHWTTYGYQSPMANKASLDFWRQVASVYKDFGTVIFELYNEPYGIEPSVWLAGNETYAGFQDLYNVVRDTGANNLCIINGLDYAYDLSFVSDTFKVDGINIVYGSHPYDKKTNFDDNFKGVLGKFPLIFTEFGVNESAYFPTDYQAVYQNVLDYANKNHISYTGFAWWPGEDVFPSLIKGDPYGEPLNGGVLIHSDMQQDPGASLQ